MPDTAVIEERSAKPDIDKECRFVWPPLVLAIVMLWLIPMATSLGLDETGNNWVIQGGLRESWVRSGIWAGTSWISNALMIAARALGGDHEAVLRAPSVLAAGTTLFFLYWLGKRLVGQLAAAYACLVFVCLRDVVYVASTMRPYAVAVLCATGSMFFLTRWLDTGSRKFQVAYALLAAATIHGHYLFAPMLLVHLVYYELQRRSDDPPPIRFSSIVWTGLAITLMVLPLAPNLITLLSRNVSSLYLGPPDTSDFLVSIAPPLLLGSITLAVLISMAIGRAPFVSFRLAQPVAPFLAAWVLIPTGALFAVSILTNVHVFAERYYLASAPAIALIAGSLISAFSSESVRRTIASTIAICAVLVFGVHEQFFRGLHDWRAAASAAHQHIGNASTPVLVVSGFTESSNLSAVEDPRYAEVLYAPVMRYPTGGKLVRLPVALQSETEPYLERIVQTELQGTSEFLLFGIDSYSTREYRRWLTGRTGLLHFTPRLLGNYGGIQVTVFTRQEQP